MSKQRKTETDRILPQTLTVYACTGHIMLSEHNQEAAGALTFWTEKLQHMKEAPAPKAGVKLSRWTEKDGAILL